MTPTERRDAFGRAIADRVQPHVPRSLLLAPEGEYIEVSEAGTRWGGPWLGDPEDYDELHVAIARLEIALSSLQDDLVHMVNGAWPSQVQDAGLPGSWIRVDSDVIRFGFGALELEPIPLEAVGFPPGRGAA